MDIRTVPIAKVQPWERNPRNIRTDDFKRLKRQIEDLGIYKPLIVIEEDGHFVTLGGNMRLRALQELGMTDVDISVVRAESEAEKLKFNLSDNDQAGEYVEEELTELIYEFRDELELTDFKIDLGPSLDLKVLLDRVSDEYETNPNPYPDEQYESDETFRSRFGFSNASVWLDLAQQSSETWEHLIHPPANKNEAKNAIRYNYSRANPVAIERIVKLWMEDGDYFYEPCAGWATFSSIAKHFGYSGEALDNWEFSTTFCKKSIEAMPGDGHVQVHLGDAMAAPFGDATFDFIHMNPPFGNLESYGGNSAGSAKYDEWIVSMQRMMTENCRVLKSEKFCIVVIADWREKGILRSGHGDFIAAATRAGFHLHDLVVCRIPSQSLRFSMRNYAQKHTSKTHEYVLVFKKSK